LPADRRSYRIQVALFFITVLGLGFFFTVQVRSQAAADQLLSGQDNVSLGLLITGLAQSNLRLVEARGDLGRQEQQLSASATSPNSAGQQLEQQLSHLQILNGTVPVHGPGVELKVGFSMQSFELQDLANAMRQLGAEAVSVNDRRLTARTVIGEKNGTLRVDGRSMSAPYDFRVVGDPAQLFAGAGQLLTQLKARGYATLDQQGDIHITAVVRERPQVYSSFG
jgi:uncharacterized protein YlxW (UPF0749 family)